MLRRCAISGSVVRTAVVPWADTAPFSAEHGYGGCKSRSTVPGTVLCCCCAAVHLEAMLAVWSLHRWLYPAMRELVLAVTLAS